MATTITLSGTYHGHNDEPISGRVIITPDAIVYDTDDDVVLTRSPINLVLDEDGAFSVVLPHNDSADLNPQDVTLKVQEKLSGLPTRTYHISLPSSLGSSVDITTLAPVSSSSGTVTQVPGPAGADGSDGVDGTNGTNGTSFLVGSAAPGGGTGALGDVYLDTTSGLLYGPKQTPGSVTERAFDDDELVNNFTGDDVPLVFASKYTVNENCTITKIYVPVHTTGERGTRVAVWDSDTWDLLYFQDVTLDAGPTGPIPTTVDFDITAGQHIAVSAFFPSFPWMMRDGVGYTPPSGSSAVTYTGGSISEKFTATAESVPENAPDFYETFLDIELSVASPAWPLAADLGAY